MDQQRTRMLKPSNSFLNLSNRPPTVISTTRKSKNKTNTKTGLNETNGQLNMSKSTIDMSMLGCSNSVLNINGSFGGPP